jgi:hypothetical protein
MKDRWLYPAEWETLAWKCKEKAGWCCEHCGVAQGTQAVSERTGVVYPIHLGCATVFCNQPARPAVNERATDRGQTVGLGHINQTKFPPQL